ncbi:asparagine synthase-related protein [Nonomuraea basaltis]|uniref:asparagine synthase-related protein n=1 Tax=Nonomuraea basaltis TaxID=2495887 RepID=UPI00110C4759|nr:asparagine synthase-related protein [Nonomuraea basaltis]TMR99100.1 asparagine synthase [Nonomuraea basaltis]
MGPGLGDRWFAVLPDSAAGAAVCERLPGRPALLYASGHPCVLTGSSVEPVVAEAGRTRLAVIGCTSVTADQLALLAGRIECLEDADAVSASAGCFHLVAAVDGQVRVQGTASGGRRVFHARVGDTVVAADRASTLAYLTGASLDVDALAVQLVGNVPPVLAIPMWQGIDQVSPGDALHIDARRISTGQVSFRSWWFPPEPELSLERGALAFAIALSDAVQARIGTGDTVESDLSGGLDSTPVSFLADAAVRRRGGRLVTFSQGVEDAAHDDHVWTTRARRHLSGEHLHMPSSDVPGWFADSATPVPGLDEPTPWLRGLAQTTTISALLAKRGATVHLSGHGGDEVTLLPRSYLHDLARTHPALLLPHLRAARAQVRWPLTAALRALADTKNFPAWLNAQIPLLTTPVPLASGRDFGWQWPIRLPAWTTPAAVDAVTRRIRQAATTARPYSPLRAQHQILNNVRIKAGSFNAIHHLTSQAGAALHAPFLDDHVVTAALAIRLDQRAAPGRFKPLTTTAMRPHMPAECLARTTKAAFSALFYDGLRAHRDQLRALAEGSRLVDLGFADPEALRRAYAYTPTDAGRSMVALDLFVSAENWLRAQDPRLPMFPATDDGDHAFS